MAKKETARRLIPRVMELLLPMLLVLLLYIKASAGSSAGSTSHFPGVSLDLATFCAARPSLAIDLATMVVHVKKNVMFNYKLYLFSQQHVFQTGQVIPRDDFRIHSFPVKLKKLREFWPETVPTQRYMRNESGQFELIDSHQSFDLSAFLSPVPIEPGKEESKQPTRSHRQPDESFSLPGDELSADELATSVASDKKDDLNSGIEFDRDDQVSVARLGAYVSAHKSTANQTKTGANATSIGRHQLIRSTSASIVPVGSFSSFQLNTTYLVRKDFGQVEPELIKIVVDAQQFQVRQLILINDGHQSSYLSGDDYAFLKHKLLRDANTRVTSISQIYEDWITRNFYTLVYIQRKLEQQDAAPTLVTDRLIFRGASTTLLGADQLDYPVKATAFITEKNGLHYYLEFLPTNKFYLCAIDWTKRPFKIIDSHQFPIKATRTQLDNEELLLCPPSVCHSSDPLDEVIAYGRLSNVTSRAGSQRAARRDLDIRLHLRDWHWSLDRPASPDNISNSNNRSLAHTNDADRAQSSFGWRYERARRNEIKAKQDNYGYALTGHQIDASYRLNNELYLVSANHLITINYTLANETATSSHLIGDEFPGLSSTLLEPITGAFYDRVANQIYFFKGDRYIGFDYATKKPLEEFQLQAPEAPTAGVLIQSQMLLAAPITQHQLVSSLPVVGILGRQHEVDGVYHDLATDLVYIFSGMKYYTFMAEEFENGSFVPHKRSLPPMLCINQHFLRGCHFDEAFPNTCSSSFVSLKGVTQDNAPTTLATPTTKSPQREFRPLVKLDEENKRKQDEFRVEQQMKLRSIAAGQQSTARLLSRLLVAPAGDMLLNSGRLVIESSRPPARESRKQSNREELELEEELSGASEGNSDRGRIEADRVVIYLLVAMVGMTVLITIVMIVVIINWTKEAHKSSAVAASAARQLHLASLPPNNGILSNMSHLYLRNQEDERRRRAFHHQQRHSKASPPKTPIVSVVGLKTNNGRTTPTMELVDSSIL